MTKTKSQDCIFTQNIPPVHNEEEEEFVRTFLRLKDLYSPEQIGKLTYKAHSNVDLDPTVYQSKRFNSWVRWIEEVITQGETP